MNGHVAVAKLHGVQQGVVLQVAPAAGEHSVGPLLDLVGKLRGPCEPGRLWLGRRLRRSSGRVALRHARDVLHERTLVHLIELVENHSFEPFSWYN